MKFWIKEGEGLYYPCSENKGADQLRGYREADLRLCFRPCKLLVFSRTAEAVLTSTHNLCFGAKIRKIGIPLQTPVFLYKSGFKGVFDTRTCFPDVKRRLLSREILLNHKIGLKCLKFRLTRIIKCFDIDQNEIYLH